MTETLLQAAPPAMVRTEHPHVVKREGVLGGKATVEGQRISVLQIFQMYRDGYSIDEIIESHPTLRPAAIHDALSYAYDHPDEIAADAERQTLRSVLKRANLAYVNGQLIPRSRLADFPISPNAEVYTWETLPPDLSE